MAVTIANQVRNHRGIYAEVTGDGATTALVFTHNSAVHANTTASAFVVTAPTVSTIFRRSSRGGFHFPADGTAATVSSVVVTATTVTVNTSAAVANGTLAYVAVVFDQESASL
jgi:hypothetical protein